MNESNKTLRATPTLYACSTAGGGVMFIPNAIERMQSNIVASELNSELNMDSAISYKDLLPKPETLEITPKNKNFITKSINRAKKLLAKAS